MGIEAAIIGSAIVGAGASVANSSAANNQAAKQQAYNAEVTRLQKAYRLDVMDYQNTGFAHDIDFYNKQIAYQEDEFGKNVERAGEAVKLIDQDFYGLLATQMTKMVEQDMGEAFGIIDTASQVRAETGAFDARSADSGVGGNVTNIMRGDIARQGGEASTMISINADVARRQTSLETQGLAAQRDNGLSQITIPTFQPIQPPAPPAPVSPVSPTAPTSRVGAGAMALNAISSGINLGVGVSSIFGK